MRSGEQRADIAEDDPQQAARAAGLTYVSDGEPGLSRTRHGRGFSYRDARGRPISDRRRRRISELAIPPAWTDVWICAQADGHIQATGTDDRGRKQYLYHERWRQARSQATFDRLLSVGTVLPSVRREVAAQLRRRTVDNSRVLAAMVRILDLTGIRVGNESYERENNTVGLCTLRWSHITLTPRRAIIRYTAKSKVRTRLDIDDPSVLRLLRQLQDAPRRRVFRVDGIALQSGDVNGYLTMITGAHLTAKDFRTWLGTVSALRALLSWPAEESPSRRRALAAVDVAAAALRNTRSVARAHYVHPIVTDRYLAGNLPRIGTPVAGLTDTESILLTVLADQGAAPARGGSSRT